MKTLSISFTVACFALVAGCANDQEPFPRCGLGTRMPELRAQRGEPETVTYFITDDPNVSEVQRPLLDILGPAKVEEWRYEDPHSVSIFWLSGTAGAALTKRDWRVVRVMLTSRQGNAEQPAQELSPAAARQTKP
jgi:hypothetical protein